MTAAFVHSITGIKSFFEEQRKYLNYFFDHLEIAKAEEILSAFLKCEGSLIFTGVGKSGIIAQKLSATFLSIGIKAFFLPPIDALHGDLGVLSEKDLLILLSKSGETEELLKMLPYVRKKKARVVSFVSNPKSKLAKDSDISITLPLLRELCPFNLAPTTSTTLQLLFGDVLAIAMMRKKNFTLDDFALNHPSGMIGKKITLLVKDLMLQGEAMPLCSPEDLLMDVLCVLSEKRCGTLLVVDEKKRLKGIFTDGDLRRSLHAQGGDVLQKKMRQIMTDSARSTSQDRLAVEAMKQMEEDPNRLITVLPVLQDGTVVGILRMHDILQAGLRDS
jgi:arabinose-5-phosphate isomerase